MLSQEYNRILLEGIDETSINILAGYGTEAYKWSFDLFYPLIGKDFHKEKNLMVVGQATNGWLPKFTIENDVLDKLVELINEATNYSKYGEKCPLEWINEDWTKKEYGLSSSFFWNIIYKLVKSFYNRTDSDWNNIIVWSNLMKIAPTDGGNPDNILIRSQRKMASKLFCKEIEELKPKNVLLLTNLYKWAKPIFDYSGITYKAENSKFIEAITDYQGSRIIVAKRGYLKEVTHELAIQEVSKYLIR